MNSPLCFVLMPFGKKPNASGTIVDFDGIYSDLIVPAIELAGMTPLRADQEHVGGLIHKIMYERLILCDYAIADLSTANANVFYELGLRHAVRPHTTILLHSKDGTQRPFDVAPLRSLPYSLAPGGKLEGAKKAVEALAGLLAQARAETHDQVNNDSPVFQMVKDYAAPPIDHLKTDMFRDQVRYNEAQKKKLAEARGHKDRLKAVEALRALEAEFAPIRDLESGVAVDLFLSYRGVKAFTEMEELAKKMSAPLARTVMVREQLGLALNRLGKRKAAADILLELIAELGPRSETYGILGRVYKDAWEEARDADDPRTAKGYLEKAIDAYRKGFEADWRDAYPGINAVTLMEIKEPPDPERLKLLPLVTYAVERKMASGSPDYWDHATLLELAVLVGDNEKAGKSLDQALAGIREVFEPETTARNLGLIRKARESRGENVAWLLEMERELLKKAGK